MLNIAVFVSGGGTNLQALIDAQDRGEIKNGKITFVLASNEGAYALERAKKAGIESTVVSRKAYGSKAEYDRAVLDALEGRNIDLIVLAGFLSILGEDLINEYKNRIINIHPSLIPLFCGDGFYGKKVQIFIVVPVPLFYIKVIWRTGPFCVIVRALLTALQKALYIYIILCIIC